MSNVHELSAKTIEGQSKSLGDYRGKVLLVVNVASRCGLTPHYTGLEKLYRDKRAAGLEVLGFPCNQFGAQEPGTESEIQSFCQSKYDVTFPMFAKIDVNGPQRHPLYAQLTQANAGPATSGDIAWNFEKFVIGKDGTIVARFAPPTAPDDPALVATIDRALAAPAA
jgi:glutathione peroxidase